MHTPDGFLTDWVCVALLLATLGSIAYAVFNLRKTITREKAVMMAGLGAAIFAFQMLNFPISGGTSGHLIGGALAAILLGPEAAVLILFSVLLVQTILFADGGVMAFGANVFNMGVVAAYAAHFVYEPLKKKFELGAVFLASWVSVVAASVACALELALSGASPLSTVLPAMVITHAVIGLGEGVITTGAVLYYQATKLKVKNSFAYVAGSTALAVLVMALLLPFASPHPDGLEAVAINLGFFDSAFEVYSLAPMPDYTLLGSEAYLYVLGAGVAGSLATFAVAYLASTGLRSLSRA